MHNLHILTSNYTIRESMHMGKKHLILPVIMLTEGVHIGSHGPLLHLAEELGRYPHDWNDIPVAVPHPQEDGSHVSARQPHIIENFTVGRVYHTQMDGGKLRAEAWIDEAAISRVSPEALAYILQGRPLDVSVGVFTDDDPTAGEWNGEAYEAIARGHRPDHLALLPGGTGACAWADGCGIRTHQKGGGDVKNQPAIHEEFLKKMVHQGLSFSVNEMGFREISQNIQTKLDRMDDDSKVHYLEETFDDHFIYRIAPRSGGPVDEALYSRGYQTAADGSIEFTGEAQPVVKKVEYVTANINANQKDGETMKNPCCPEKVKALIAMAGSQWTEADEPMLLTMSAEQLEKLTPPAPAADKPPEAPAVMSKEQALQVLQEHLGDPDKALALFPKEIREQLQDGLNLHRERRVRLIDQIVTNQASPIFTKEKLEGRPMADLVELAQAIAPKTDFTPLGGGPAPASYEGEMLLPPGVEG